MPTELMMPPESPNPSPFISPQTIYSAPISRHPSTRSDMSSVPSLASYPASWARAHSQPMMSAGTGAERFRVRDGSGWTINEEEH